MKWIPAPFPGISEIFLNWEEYEKLSEEEKEKIRKNLIMNKEIKPGKFERGVIKMALFAFLAMLFFTINLFSSKESSGGQFVYFMYKVFEFLFIFSLFTSIWAIFRYHIKLERYETEEWEKEKEENSIN